MPWTATPVEWEVRWGPDHYSYENSDDFTGVAKIVRAGHEAYVSLTCGTGLTLKETREVHAFCKAHGMWPVRWVHRRRAQQSEKSKT